MSNLARKRLRRVEESCIEEVVASSSGVVASSSHGDSVASYPAASPRNSPVYSPYNPSSPTAASPDYSPESPSYHPTSPSYHPTSPAYYPVTFSPFRVDTSPLSPSITALSPHNSPLRQGAFTSDSPLQDSDRGGHEEVNAFQMAEQLFRAVPLSEVEQLQQLELDDLLQTSIASTFRAAIGFTFARDGTNFLAAEKKRLQAEKEGLAARVVELERKLSIERGLMASRFTELEGKNAQLHVLDAMLEEEKQRNANLQRKLESLPEQVKAALDAFQTSREFKVIKDDEYSRGFADCRARVGNHFAGIDLSFLDQYDPGTPAARE